MFRRLAALVAVLSLLTFASPTMTLARSAAPASGAVGSDNVQNCPIATSQHYWTGATNSAPYSNRTAVQAFFRPSSTGFESCSYIQYVSTWASWWIALEPRSGGNFNTILQIGLIKCEPGPFMPSFCDSVPHYVWAEGGCNGYTPTWHDLGPGDWNRHPFVIYQNGPTYRLQVNGGPYGWNGYAGKYVDTAFASNPAINCWINKTTGNYSGNVAVWNTEKVVTQDSIGDSNNVSVMDTAAYAVNEGGWQNPGWPSGYVCNAPDTDPHDHCVYTGAQSAEFWTAQ